MTPLPNDRVILAVDFGTFNTAAVLSREGQPPQPLLLDGSPSMPSAVLATQDGRLLVGRDAQRAAAADPASCEPNPKRRIDDDSVLLRDHEFPTATLIGAVLRRIADTARAVTGADPDEVVLTHPAGWGTGRRDVLMRAASEAGWNAPQLVPEPVAAARHFVSDQRRALNDGEAALVYDLGAGTCDITVLVRRNGNVAVAAVDGMNDVGGLDIDHLIVEQLRDRHPDAAAWERLLTPHNANDRRQRRTLWEDARSTKELLSRESVASLHIPLVNVDTHLTRDELNEWARPLLRATAQLAGELIRSSAEQGVAVSRVYLTGGGSRIPLAATELLRETGIAATLTDQPELVIASGAALTRHALEAPAVVPVSPVAAAIPAAPPATGPLPAPAPPRDVSTGPIPTPAPPHDVPPAQAPPPGTTPEVPHRGPSRRSMLIVGGLAALGAVTGAAVTGYLLWSGMSTLAADGPVRALVFSDDGATLATASSKGTVQLWTVSNGEKSTLKVDGTVTALASVMDGRFVTCGKDGASLVSSGEAPYGLTGEDYRAAVGWGETFYLASPTEGVEQWNSGRREMDDTTYTFPGLTNMRSLAINFDGDTLYAAGERGVEQLSLTDDTDTSFTAETAHWVAVSPDGKTVAAAGNKQTWLWNAADAKEIATLDSGRTAGVAIPSNDVIATAGERGVQLWDPATGELSDTLTEQPANRLAVTLDGKTLASVGTDGEAERTVSLWSL